MHATTSRRSFLAGLPALSGLGVWMLSSGRAWANTPMVPAIREDFPRTAPELVKELVGVAHRDGAEVRRLVERQPSLARAAWDWGFGDWESGLGAASHTGQREIAEILLHHGAHPTIFSSAMLGQLDVVKACVAARPGIQRTLGPHGLTLLWHAQKGGTTAEPVVAYLESLGDADTGPALQPLDNADRDVLVGRYIFGAGPRDHFEVDVQKDQLGILRPDGTRARLFHTGNLVFFPAGVPSVKIAFARNGSRAVQLTIADPEVVLTARRDG